MIEQPWQTLYASVRRAKARSRVRAAAFPSLEKYGSVKLSGSKAMKAIVIDGEFGFDHLKSVDRPEPKPRRGEIVIRTSAVSLNYRDTDMVAGTYPFKFPLPLVPTSDGVGTVVAVGDGVTRAKIGDRVLGTFWQSWIAGDFDQTESVGQLGGSMDGMLQEFVSLDQEGIVHAPEHLTDEEAATLPCAALTVWQALVTEGRLKAGETVLVQGTGGVSIFALQFAVMFGARSIVTSSSDAKLEKARKLGATHTINYVKTPVWHPDVRRLNGGRGIDHVIEVGGPDSFMQSLQAIRLGGQIHMIGYVGSKTGEMNPLEILYRRAVVRGIPIGSRESFEHMNRAIALHQMRPVVDRVFPWMEARAALQYMREGKHLGKIVLKF
jgi:NADPH:quinone reductase-like Zn-dependent oxidoreductase